MINLSELYECMSNIVITFTFLHDITFLALEFVNFEINWYIFSKGEVHVSVRPSYPMTLTVHLYQYN